ncbi:hypothetical protein DFJ74DRAFT_710313 [Hyaloraphidium curvatum]|nr:hypothetical protein DFJ74DRAFT_710313 [Hyaloraphidium curvatum]
MHLSNDATPNPLSAYGRAKLESEAAALAVPGNLVVRTAWVWGTDRGGKKSFTDFRFGGGHLGLDWGWLFRAGLYHAAGSDWVSRLEWADRVATIFGLDAGLIEQVTTAALNLPAHRPLKSGLSSAKLERDTGFRMRGLDAQLDAIQDQG